MYIICNIIITRKLIYYMDNTILYEAFTKGAACLLYALTSITSETNG